MSLREALGDGSTGLIACDIDDTIIKADASEIGIWKISPDGEERLSTEEFAKDSDKGKPGVKYDYREFADPEKVRKSILKGTPLIKNLKMIDEKLNEGYDFAFLTARSAEDVIKEVFRDFMKRRTEEGELVHLGSSFKEGLSVACNDEKYCEILDGMTDAGKKVYFLEKMCKQYDHVVFFDDDERNVEAAREANLENLTIIKV